MPATITRLAAEGDLDGFGVEAAGKDAVELGKYLKDTYGIEAAAGGMMMAGPAAAAAAPAEEKTSFDVILKGSDAAKKIGVIKVVREATGLGLAEAKAFVEAPGKAVKQGLPKAAAIPCRRFWHWSRLVSCAGPNRLRPLRTWDGCISG